MIAAKTEPVVEMESSAGEAFFKIDVGIIRCER